MKKKYPNYLKNQAKRRDNPNIRKIREGSVTSYWVDLSKKTEHPQEAVDSVESKSSENNE